MQVASRTHSARSPRAGVEHFRVAIIRGVCAHDIGYITDVAATSTEAAKELIKAGEGLQVQVIANASGIFDSARINRNVVIVVVLAAISLGTSDAICIVKL
jgi:hypothetical protein